MNFPENLKYTNTHEWLKIDGDSGVCGITDFAQSELSDVVFVELKPVGTKVNKGEAVGTIEAVKAVSDVYAPVSGEIVEINSNLSKTPELVNKSPYGDGWMVKLKVTNASEANELLPATEYTKVAKH